MITPDSSVILHFSLSKENGDIIDSTFDKKPAQMAMGDGSLLPYFEVCLLGMQVGEKQSFSMPPEKAFGQRNDANLQTIKRHQFGVDMVLDPGLVVSFSDAANTELPGVIKSIEGDEVIVDFNHPLAGLTLQFRVEIIAVS